MQWDEASVLGRKSAPQVHTGEGADLGGWYNSCAQERKLRLKLKISSRAKVEVRVLLGALHAPVTQQAEVALIKTETSAPDSSIAIQCPIN